MSVFEKRTIGVDDEYSNNERKTTIERFKFDKCTKTVKTGKT